ncbi:MAG: ATP-binding protein [Bacillota bacterium]
MSLSEIHAEYERIRAQEREALCRRTEEAAYLHPGFLAIAQKRREAALSVGDAVRRGMNPEEAALAAQSLLSELDKEERALLRAVGLPENHLTLHYRCELCQDTGYVGAPRRMPCICMQKRLLAQARATSQIDERETFETFDSAIYPTDTQRRQMLAARRVAEQYAQSFPHTGTHNLLLLGSSGLGKTFLINSIAARVLSRGFPLHKITAYTMFEHLLAGIRRNADGAAPFLTAPMLLIDDLGTEPMMQNITLEYLFSILNERRNGALHTVVASNLTVDKLQERYGERVFSRLVSADDTQLLQLTGENLRLCPRPREET